MKNLFVIVAAVFSFLVVSQAEANKDTAKTATVKAPAQKAQCTHKATKYVQACTKMLNQRHARAKMFHKNCVDKYKGNKSKSKMCNNRYKYFVKHHNKYMKQCSINSKQYFTQCKKGVIGKLASL